MASLSLRYIQNPQMAISIYCLNHHTTDICICIFFLVLHSGLEEFVVEKLGLKNNFSRQTSVKIAKTVIQKGFDKARNIRRSQSLKSKTASDQTVRNFALILDYHPNFSGLPLLTKDHLKILFEPPRMRKVFSQDKHASEQAFVELKILDMLVKSSVQPVTTPQIDNPGCFKCHRKVCDACQNFLLPYRRIISVATGKSYKIRQHQPCGTDFVIYCAFCKKCNSVSVQPLILVAVCPTIGAT